MVKVAIAGATATTAQAITSELSSQGKHPIVALIRSPNAKLSATPNVTVKVVDYEDQNSLTSALEGCHTIISCLFSKEDEGRSSAIVQHALLNAALQVPSIKRFAPSDFGIPNVAAKIVERMQNRQSILDELEKHTGRLEYTQYKQGIFMNYFCTGSPREEEGLCGLKPMAALLDVINAKAMIPGDDENMRITMTEMGDMARFVAASLDLETWETDSRMVGTTLSYEEMVEVAEKVTGKKFERSKIPMEQLEAMSKSEGPMRFAGQALLAHAMGYAELQPRLNELCPKVKPIGYEEFMQKFWGRP